MTAHARESRARLIDAPVVAPYRFRGSHHALLEPPPRVEDTGPGSGGPGDCDAVIVPSHNHPDRLGFAADTASALGAELLVICTEGMQDVVRTVVRTRRRPPRCWVVPLPYASSLPGFESRAEREHLARWSKYRDVSVKRNLALAVAHMTGWRNVLLLDDDVRALPAHRVREAFGWLAGGSACRVASWRSASFEDNSAVCHAGRLAGVEQDVFVGSGAMALRLGEGTPFFPPVYNEDWCFLFDLLARRQVILAGDVRQLVYDPFDPCARRGAEEEFGDLLGEGLYHLLHEEEDVGVAERHGYWRHVMEDRVRTVRRIQESLQDSRNRRRISPYRARRAIACLDSALMQHGDGLAESLAGFVRAWRRDLPRWYSWCRALPSAGDLPSALDRFDLTALDLTRRGG